MATTEADVLGRYERRLTEKYRFGLHVIIDHMSCLVSLFHRAQTELKSLEALAQKKLPQMLPFLNLVHDKINVVTQATPLFLGYDHLLAYIKILQQEKQSFDPRPQPWNALRLYDTDYQDQFATKVDVFTTLTQELDVHVREFHVQVERHASLLQLLSQKREAMYAILQQVQNQQLPTNQKKHKAELKGLYERSLVKYKQALQAGPIKLEKQIQHEIRHFTAHLRCMVLPHWRVCHTVRRANAEVSPESPLSSRQLELVEAFISVVMHLHDHVGDFCRHTHKNDWSKEEAMAALTLEIQELAAADGLVV
ncbi:hypothetical protein DYB36_000301 [Aphanomyces astaci]|uniref:Uncharacterized protein n=2 Tax=Aphanomyces astaci TaxID=112090 RepID=A0A397AS46_APHAT|nr:hypothetical protein DYB36_000301 [Aphanomyces astaci]